PLPLFLLLGRDVCLFLFFAFARVPRRVEGATMFYLVILYMVAPWLLSAAAGDEIAELVLPPVLTSPGKATVVAAVQLAIAGGLPAWRWGRYQRPEAPAAQG